jgi:hypothetical protein
LNCRKEKNPPQIRQRESPDFIVLCSIAIAAKCSSGAFNQHGIMIKGIAVLMLLFF